MQVGGEEQIQIHLDQPNKDQQAEDEFFRNAEDENADAELYRSLLYVGKALSLLTFDEMVERFGLSFEGSVLELGGGYGYLSTYLKKRRPDLTVVYSDVSSEAVRKSRQYEDFFGVRLDGKWVTAAENTPFEAESFERVFFFASFHHVQDPAAAVRECSRLLRPGGKLFLLFEPSCPGYLKPFYDFHVRRETVKERYYTIREYRRFFQAASLGFRHENFRSYLFRRSQISTLYYVFLSALPGFLSNAFPCSQVIVGEKSHAS